MLVLGIESSCDDLGFALVRDGREILASVVASQDDVHAPYGGVVPELASRDHVRKLWGTLERALASAELRLADVEGIGVTNGPGLIGSLLVGASFAKGLAYRTGLPLCAVHHIQGHLASARLGDDPLELPFVGLVASGGHTALYRVESLADVELLGQTRDDAAGEAFDKFAKHMGLGYPGGREIDRLARSGRRDAVPLPRPMLAEPGLEFSFSGLKTAAALAFDRRTEGAQAPTPADFAASFQEAVVDVLLEKTLRAVRATDVSRVAVVGGLAANSRLRACMSGLQGLEVRFPPIPLCTDNAAMIAAVADSMLAAGEVSGLDLDVFSRAPIGAPLEADGG